MPVICGLARCNKKDIDAAWEAVRHAKKPRVHTFIATSEIHLQHKLRKTREEVVNIAREMVAYARSLGCQDIEFSPEDAGRSCALLVLEFVYLRSLHSDCSGYDLSGLIENFYIMFWRK